ncbi:MAG: Low molecular weight protein-tyrosine-phosphatase YfkJ [Paraeggerthella hongkongensis]|uniref:low molecular weight protein-tyrosine-phosphatase n=1 Tax=Paraeggerthella hominis TaxID=2897351 RepID=UPI001C104DCA|nr:MULTISPECIES: low molecular weight protein-tyrosine-phosphatase [Paraeggerthella]MBU5404420.1 low molecular weight phosphotyrosine protein phosphatase [Paraeggerthella hongkongensis]MCD2432116.1 low molecular weight phosphotyrosine protein phosphatase [Paraeggerthella hominis]
MSAPYRILFVCHGNICRSTMAEFVMKDLVAKRGLADAFVIESAATHDDEIGSPVHSGTRAVLAAQGIDCAGKRARRLKRADAGEWDLFVGMDEANMRDMRRQLGREAEGRCIKLLEFADTDRDVADPWYTGDFETTYDDVLAGCTGLLAWLNTGGRRG